MPDLDDPLPKLAKARDEIVRFIGNDLRRVIEFADLFQEADLVPARADSPLAGTALVLTTLDAPRGRISSCAGSASPIRSKPKA